MAIQLSEHFTYGKLFRFVLPSVGTMAFTSIYGVVDGLFVSNFVGKTAFAAVNLIMPLLMMIGAVGFMLGAGGSALVSRTLGEGDSPRANRFFSMIVTATFLSGVALSILGFIFMPQISELLGADPGLLVYCVPYGRTVIAFNAVFMLQQLFQTFFVTAEKPKLGLYFTVAAGLSNMALDAIFVVLFNWGVTGAALATGLSQCVGGILPFVYFAGKNGSLLRFRLTRLETTPILQSCANGSSELLTNISSSVVAMAFNHQLIEYSGENGVSAYGVVMYVAFLFIAIYIGYAIGCAPLFGFNFGAGNRKELKNLLKKSLIIMAVTGGILTALAELLAKPVSMLFVGYDPVLMEMTSHAFTVYSLCFLLAGICIFTSAFFTALSNGKISAFVSVMRTLVFQLLSVLFLPVIFGIEGIWWSVIVAEVCSFILSVLFIFVKRRKYGYN